MWSVSLTSARLYPFSVSFITCKGFGQLVQVSFDIAVFTLPAYQRGSLPRPSMEVSSWRWLRA